MMSPMTATAISTLPGNDQDAIRPPWSMARRRFLKNKLAVLGFAFLVVLVLACFFSLHWTVHRFADQQQLKHVREAPSGEFWMGTDVLGRDLLARFLLGGAISLSIGIASAIIAILIGTTVGVVAG